MMGHNGGPPMAPGGVPNPPPADGAGPVLPSPSPAPQPPMAPPMMGPQMPPPPTPEQKQAMLFQKAVQLLRDDKLRGFRIDIETDSMIEPDAQAAKQSATELLTGTLQGLEAAGPILQMAPEMARPIGDLMLFTFRKFRVGRSMESQLEEAVDSLVKRLSNPAPPPPTPEQVKADAAKQQAVMDQQAAQQQLQHDQERNQMELQTAQQKNVMDIEKGQAELQIKREELALKREELAMKQQEMQLSGQMKEREMALSAAATEHKAAVETDATERQAELSAEGDQRKHDLALETAEAKAKMAKTAKPAAK